MARRGSRSRWLPVLVALVLAGGLAAAATLVPGYENRRITGRLVRAVEAADRSGSYALTLRLSLVDPSGRSTSTDASADVDVTADRAHVRLPPVVGPGNLELVSQGTILFLSIPAERQAAVGGARWVRVNARSTAVARGAEVGPLPDPMTIRAALAGVTGPVERIGSRRIDGVAATGYRATVSIRELEARLAQPGRAHVRSLRRLGPDRLRAEVWLDKAGRARSLRLTASLGREGKVIAHLRVGGFGAPVVIGIPPNDAVHPAATVAEALAVAGAGR